METLPTNNLSTGKFSQDQLMTNDIITSAAKTPGEFKNLFLPFRLPWMDDFINKFMPSIGKKSFLVFKNNKYVSIPTENVAFFYIRYESAVIMCFDQQEYFVKYSLDQIQSLLSEKQFYRLNRQYLINFDAVKEVEHYFARKLLVNSVIPTKDKLIVSKEKVSEFLHWLDNR